MQQDVGDRHSYGGAGSGGQAAGSSISPLLLPAASSLPHQISCFDPEQAVAWCLGPELSHCLSMEGT